MTNEIEFPQQSTELPAADITARREGSKVTTNRSFPVHIPKEEQEYFVIDWSLAKMT